MNKYTSKKECDICFAEKGIPQNILVTLKDIEINILYY